MRPGSRQPAGATRTEKKRRKRLQFRGCIPRFRHCYGNARRQMFVLLARVLSDLRLSRTPGLQREGCFAYLHRSTQRKRCLLYSQALSLFSKQRRITRVWSSFQKTELEQQLERSSYFVLLPGSTSLQGNGKASV